MGCKTISIFVFVVFLLGLASASFIFSGDGSSITTQYDISDYLEANINISFYNESLNSTFIDSLGHSIALGTLLGVVLEYDYIFYDITNTTISSAFQALEFGKADFQMPSTTGNFTYYLNFSGIKLFEKTFEIMSTNTLIDEMIDEKYSNLNASKTEIKKYDLFVQKILNEFLNITFIEDDLQKIEIQYENAGTSAEYTKILENLSNIKIPKGISVAVNTNSISFYPNRENINLDVLQIAGGGDYSENPDGYIDAIYLWNDENLKTAVTFREILINYGLNEGVILRIFQFEFDKRDMGDDAYFIIEKIADLKFGEEYSSMEESGYIYIDLKDVSDKIIFSTTEDVNFLDVPVFISPSLVNLNLAEVGEYTEGEDKSSKWLLFGLIAFLLLLIAVVAYITLQIWYRRKYENYLFKNRNNLYNIMTYIQNAKKKGMERGEIMKNLKKSNWTREQINYALQKYEGKKIAGIIERPFKKIIQELEKKPSEAQKNPSDIQKKP